jgi:hypothetical protein
MLNTTRSYARELWLLRTERADIEQRYARYTCRFSEVQLAV